jgi:multiple sugar transport system permease protein
MEPGAGAHLPPLFVPAIRGPCNSGEHRRLRLEAVRWMAAGWVFLIPAMFFFVGYMLYPILRVLWISFTDYRYLSQNPARFVGLQNYMEAFADPLMYEGLSRAAQFTLMFLPGTIIFPLLLAVLVDRVTHPGLATFYRIVLLIPAVIPGPMIFVLWKWLYNFQIGPINYILVEWLGLFTPQTAPQWLGGTSLTLPAVAIFEIWWGLGYHTMFFGTSPSRACVRS